MATGQGEIAMALQTSNEVILVADDWFRNFCPPNLVKDGPEGTKNAELIMGRCLQKHGMVTAGRLTEAALAAAGKLAIIPEPKQPTQEEKAAIFQKREFVRIQKEQAENSVPFEERVAKEKAKREADAWVKGQEQARAQLGVAILDYKCYGLNHTDITGSEMVQRDLKTIRVPAHDSKGIDGKNFDYVATLEWVRAVIFELPDHPKVGDVQAAVKRVREKFAQQAAKKDRNRGW
jgi:hypothetical protein